MAFKLKPPIRRIPWAEPIDGPDRDAWEAAGRAKGLIPVSIWTDGSCPQSSLLEGKAPMAASAILVSGKVKWEYARPVGLGTNQAAELLAIRLAMEKLRYPEECRVRLYCDNAYAIGCMTQSHWVLKKNIDLIHSVRALVNRVAEIEFIGVDGHAGYEGNHHADYLARYALETGETLARVLTVGPVIPYSPKPPKKRKLRPKGIPSAEAFPETPLDVLLGDPLDPVTITGVEAQATAFDPHCKPNGEGVPGETPGASRTGPVGGV